MHVMYFCLLIDFAYCGTKLKSVMRLSKEKQIQNVINFWEDIKGELEELILFINPVYELCGEYKQEELQTKDNSDIFADWEAYCVFCLRHAKPLKNTKYRFTELTWYLLQNINKRGRDEMAYSARFMIKKWSNLDKLEMSMPEFINLKKIKDPYHGYLIPLSNLIKNKLPRNGKYIVRLNIRPGLIELHVFLNPKKWYLPVIDDLINKIKGEIDDKERKHIIKKFENGKLHVKPFDKKSLKEVYQYLNDGHLPYECLWRECENLVMEDGRAFCSSRCRWKLRQSIIHANKGKEPEIYDYDGNKVKLTEYLEREYESAVIAVFERTDAREKFWGEVIPEIEKREGVRIRANPVGRPKKKTNQSSSSSSS